MAPLNAAHALLAPTKRFDAGITLNVLYWFWVITDVLLVTEATRLLEIDPGIYSQEQIEAANNDTTRFHKAGGRIFMQIWHGVALPHRYLEWR